MKIKQSDVPVKFRRIAAQHLESIRNTQISLNTEDLYLGDEVCPIYRPDIEKPAYYEFQVLKATRENVDNRTDLLKDVRKINVFSDTGYKAFYSTAGAQPETKNNLKSNLNNGKQGFILVSAGDHDFPISHWSLESNPPSLEIENRASLKKQKVSKIYKIDALSYLGEDAKLNEVVSLGDKPSIIKGLPKDLKKYEGIINSSATIVKDTKAQALDDSHPLTKRDKTIKEGPKPPDITLVGNAWKNLKKEYKNSFKPLLDMLQVNASVYWEKQNLIEEFGEGIIAGQVFNLTVLEKEFTVEISGEAAKYVTVRVVKRPGGYSVLELTTKELPFKRETDLTVVLNYGKNNQEKVNLFVVNRGTPTKSINNLKNEEL